MREDMREDFLERAARVQVAKHTREQQQHEQKDGTAEHGLRSREARRSNAPAKAING